MIAHHVGEGLLPALVAGATAAPVLLLAVRVRLDVLRSRRGSIRRSIRARMTGT